MTSTIDENAIVSMISAVITATDGRGTVDLANQVFLPSIPEDTSIRLYNDEENLSWTTHGHAVKLDTSSFTSDRVVTIPDESFEIASADDARFGSPQVRVVKTTDAGFNEFTTVASALASITDASALTPYVVRIAPGVYIEPALTIPSYVSLIGDVAPVVTLRPVVVGTTPFITMSAYSCMSNVALSGLGNAVGVRVAAVARLIDVLATGFVTCYEVDGGVLNMTGCSVGAPFTDAIIVSGSSSTQLNTSSLVIVGDGTGRGISASGSLARVYGTMTQVNACATGIQIDDAAVAVFLNSAVLSCGVGAHVRNIGAAPSITISSATISGGTTAVLVEHPGTTGFIAGVMAADTVTIDPASSLTLNIVDPGGGIAVVGDLLYSRFSGGVLTEHGDLFGECSPLGTFNGGDITDAGGLDVSIAAGAGYTTTGTYPNCQLIKLIWPTTPLTLPAGVSYVFVDSAGIITSALALPNPVTTLILGRVGTIAGGIEFIDRQVFSAYHPSVTSALESRNTLGARYAAGSIVTSNVSRELAVTAGQYWFGGNEIVTSGHVTPTPFYAYYHSSGVFTRALATVVDNAQYDDGTNLVAIPGGKYVKHTLYTVGSGVTELYFMVYGRDLFDNFELARVGSTPTPPSYFSEGIVVIAGLIVLSGDVLGTIDLRPVGGGGGAGTSSAVTNHGDLQGLTADDHPQYLLASGVRAMAGSLNMGTNTITNVGTINGVSIAAHASRHLPNGADALSTAAPLVALGGATTNGTGIANTFARSDHSHAIDQSTLSLTSIGGTLSVPKGGTGVGSFSSGRFLVGAGTSAVTATKIAPAGDVLGTTDLQAVSNKDLEDTSTFFVDATDDTRRVGFEVGGTTGTTTTIVAAQTVDRTLTLPNATDVLVGRATVDTLVNKTLTSPVIATITNGGTLTLPTSTDVLVGRATMDVLTNKSLVDASCAVIDSDDPTKRIAFDAGGTTSTTTTLQAAQTASRVVTLPDATDVLVGRATTDVLTNKTLTLPTISSIDNGGTLTLPSGPETLVGRATTDTLTNKSLVDASCAFVDATDATKRVLINASGTTSTSTIMTFAQTANRVITLPDATDTLVGRDATATLTNKSIVDASCAIIDSGDATKRILFDAGGTTGTSTTISCAQTAGRVVILPDATTTLVGQDTTDTMTNKTLVSPSISSITNGGVITIPTGTDTLVGHDTFALLQNKSLLDTNTSIINSLGSPAAIVFNIDGLGGTVMTISCAQTVDRTLTLPDATDTLVGRDTFDVLTNKTFDIPATGFISKGGGVYFHSYGGPSNLFIGGFSCFNNMPLPGVGNIGIGDNALSDIVSGAADNVALGVYSLGFLTTGQGNTAIGRESMSFNMTGTNNVGIGRRALQNATGGTNNIAIGFESAAFTGVVNNTISIGSAGSGVSNEIYLGETGVHTLCKIAGIAGVDPGGTPQMVIVNTTDGKLGSTPIAAAVSFTAVGGSPNANGGSVSSNVITLQPADATNPGVVTTGAQTFAGAKTFSGDIAAASIAIPVVVGTPVPLSVGSTPTMTVRGSVTTLVPLYATRVGNIVSLTIANFNVTALTGAAPSVIGFSGAVGTAYRPTFTQYLPIVFRNGGANAIGVFLINTGGGFNITLPSAGALTLPFGLFADVTIYWTII